MLRQKTADGYSKYSVADLTVYFMEDSKKPKFPDNVLFQQIEQYFKPAKHWENCLSPMTTDQFFEQIFELLPGYFESPDHLRKILLALHYKYSHNEHNNKYYWLVNHV